MAQAVRSGPAKVPAPADIAARLGIAEGELCVRTTYEFLADGRPAQLSVSWEPYDLTAKRLPPPTHERPPGPSWGRGRALNDDQRRQLPTAQQQVRVLID